MAEFERTVPFFPTTLIADRDRNWLTTPPFTMAWLVARTPGGAADKGSPLLGIGFFLGRIRVNSKSINPRYLIN